MPNPMGKISENFCWGEFYCRCGCILPPEVKEKIRYLVFYVLQIARDYEGQPIIITPNGGYRCKLQNRKVGGVPTSQHMQGRAADIYMPSMKVVSLYQFLDNHMKHVNDFGPGGMGKYKTFVHVDIRKTKRAIRWIGK